MDKRLLEAAWCAVALLLLVVLWVQSSPVRANGDMPPKEAPAEPAIEVIPDEHRLTVMGCNTSQGVCMVSIQVLATYIRQRVEIAKKLDGLAASKGCAKVEVLPLTKPKIVPRPTEGGRS